MSRGNIVGPNLQTPFQHCLPLHIAVAGNAGIWRPPLQIFLHKVIHNTPFKLLAEIHHIMGNPQYFRCCPGILHGREAAAGSLTAASVTLSAACPVWLLPDLHCHTDDLIALFLQQICRHRGVHSSRHTHHHFLFHTAHVCTFPSVLSISTPAQPCFHARLPNFPKSLFVLAISDHPGPKRHQCQLCQLKMLQSKRNSHYGHTQHTSPNGRHQSQRYP